VVDWQKRLGAVFGLALECPDDCRCSSYESTTKLMTPPTGCGTPMKCSTDWTKYCRNERCGTGQRGYIITGEARYLEPYQGGA